jgi:hypothetical protein
MAAPAAVDRSYSYCLHLGPALCPGAATALPTRLRTDGGFTHCLRRDMRLALGRIPEGHSCWEALKPVREASKLREGETGGKGGARRIT